MTVNTAWMWVYFYPTPSNTRQIIYTQPDRSRTIYNSVHGETLSQRLHFTWHTRYKKKQRNKIHPDKLCTRIHNILHGLDYTMVNVNLYSAFVTQSLMR